MQSVAESGVVDMARADLVFDEVESPLGRFSFLTDDRGRLHFAGFPEGHERMAVELRSRTARLGRRDGSGSTRVRIAFEEYFAGRLDALDALPVELYGSTFQRAVWSALREIPCGSTRSYGDIARRIGQPSAARAVGLANRSNPVAIVVPCHRVIGADGSLTGYGGGLWRKEWLLAHERRE